MFNFNNNLNAYNLKWSMVFFCQQERICESTMRRQQPSTDQCRWLETQHTALALLRHHRVEHHHSLSFKIPTSIQLSSVISHYNDLQQGSLTTCISVAGPEFFWRDTLGSGHRIGWFKKLDSAHGPLLFCSHYK